MVIGEIGYLPISRTGAQLFYQLMSRRYERASTVLTSNKGFEAWGEILRDDVMAGALIDTGRGEARHAHNEDHRHQQAPTGTNRYAGRTVIAQTVSGISRLLDILTW